jgi:hypothetical protein
MTKWLGCALLVLAALSGSAASGRDLGRIDSLSSSFRDDIWIGGDPQGTQPLLRPLWSGASRCPERLSCIRAFRRVELLASPAGDAIANLAIDSTGHAVSMTGLVVTVREDSAPLLARFGVATGWSVAGEETFDPVGTRSWENLDPDASPHAKWLPVQSYRFADWSPSGVPELATWALIGVGLVALGSIRAMQRRPA